MTSAVVTNSTFTIDPHGCDVNLTKASGLGGSSIMDPTQLALCRKNGQLEIFSETHWVEDHIHVNLLAFYMGQADGMMNFNEVG